MVHLLHNLQVRPYFKYIHTRLIKSVILLTHSCLWLDDFPVSCHAMHSRTCSYGTPLWIIWLWKLWILKGFDVTLSTCIWDFSLGRNHTRLEGIVLRSLMHSDMTTTHWLTWDPTWRTYTYNITRTWCWHHALNCCIRFVLDIGVTL